MSAKASDYKLVMGAFDAERFWRDPNLAKLPAYTDAESENIVAAMDELMFPFCSADDMLVTRYAMDPYFKQYLIAAGFSFQSSPTDLEHRSGEQSRGGNRNIFELAISSAERKERLAAYCRPGARLSPFAVIPHADSFAAEYGLQYLLPSVETVKKVNSKLYSAELNKQLLGQTYSRTVCSGRELLAEGEQQLQRGALLIKDDFGVSGKGNLLIDSPAMLERMVSYISAQEKKGKDVRFLIEPLLDKEADFSCQFHVDAQGEYSLIAVQRLDNRGFAYQGSYSADQAFMQTLYKQGYFEQMKAVAHELHAAGYFGHVCIDSMSLTDGRIVPVVEINARKSMSLIKHGVDRHLARYGLEGSMTNLTVRFSNQLRAEQLLAAFEQEGLLYTKERTSGIMPLSANTLFINRTLQEEHSQRDVKGRFYCSVVGRPEERGMLLGKTKQLLESLAFKIVS